MKVDIYRMRKFEGVTSTKAFVDLIIDDEIILKGFKLIEGREGLFLGVPREKGKENNYFDTIRFVTLDKKKEIEKFVIEKYNKLSNIDTPTEKTNE